MLMVLCYALHWLAEYRRLSFMERPAVRGFAIAAMVICLLFVSSSRVSGFIYQQF